MAYSGITYDKAILQDLMLHADLSHRPPCDLAKPEDVKRQGDLNNLLCRYFSDKLVAAGSRVITSDKPITDVRLVVDAFKIYQQYGEEKDKASQLAQLELKAADNALRNVLNIERIP